MTLHAYHVDDGTWRYMVLAKNQKEASALLKVSQGYLKNHGGRYPSGGPDEKVALSEPAGIIWAKDMRILKNAWIIA